MAIASNTIFDVRSTGNNNNGGGFVPGATGTNYSTQDSPQYALTGIASAGAGNTLLYTGASADMVGNIAQVISGTNVSTGFYQITSVSVGVSITFSTNSSGGSIATGVAASVVLNIGGGLATLAQAASIIQSGGVIFLKGSATYTLTATVSFPSAWSGQVIGYTSTHGDGGQATVTTATNSVALFTLPTGSGRILLANLHMTSTAATKATALQIAAGSNNQAVVFDNCIIDGMSTAIGYTNTESMQPLFFNNCEIKNCSTDGINTTKNVPYCIDIVDCYIHSNTGNGIYVGSGATTTTQTMVTIVRTVLDSNTIGVRISSNLAFHIEGCVMSNNSSHGASIDAPSGGYTHGIVGNSIFYGNGGWGYLADSSNNLGIFYLAVRNCAFGSNTTGSIGGTTDGFGALYVSGTVSLGSSPFVGSGSFALNNTSGAGAACRGAGFPGTNPAGTGYVDIGPLQHQDSGGTTVNYLGGSAAGMSTIMAM